MVGESNLELQQVADTIIQSWEEGVQEQPIPGHLREVHKHYFGELKKRIDAKRRSSPAVPASSEADAAPTPTPSTETPSPAPPEKETSDSPS